MTSRPRSRPRPLFPSRASAVNVAERRRAYGRRGRWRGSSWDHTAAASSRPRPARLLALVAPSAVMAGGIYEQRQQRLLELLLEAGDRPLSLQALEAAGVASPATVIYELELAGYPIERVEERLPTGGRRLTGFRLAETERARLSPAAQQAWPRHSKRLNWSSARRADLDDKALPDEDKRRPS